MNGDQLKDYSVLMFLFHKFSLSTSLSNYVTGLIPLIKDDKNKYTTVENLRSYRTPSVLIFFFICRYA